MRKKIIISGPILTRSGYGEMARFAIRSLKKFDDKFDLYVMPTNWGNTGWILKADDEINFINSLVQKTQIYLAQNNNQPNFDMSLQIGIPNEWKKLAAKNIGYTAGIETNFVSPAWLQPSLSMDKIIVISEHAKSGFVNTVFADQSANGGRGVTYKITTPVEVCHFPIKNIAKTDVDLNLRHDFNFLSVCQWGPRKNLEQTIINFIEEFKNENVGLVLKVNTTNDSIMDREHCKDRLKELLRNAPQDKKCSIYLLHGNMSENEVNSLYNNPKIKAIVSTTHGEGFGFPLFEAACNEIPVIATDWSGHLDFLTVKENNEEKKLFAKIKYDLKPIDQQHVWNGVLEQGTQWAYPDSRSLKDKMRDVYKDYGRYKSQSKKLKTWIQQEFSEEKIYKKFADLVSEDFNVEDWLKNMNVEENIFEHE
jgi:glycosyltransferase involved in cell wall biosynthesis